MRPTTKLYQSTTPFIKHRKVAQQVEQAAMRKHALDQGWQLRPALWRNRRAIRGAPRHEALLIGRQRTDTGMDTIRSRQQRIGIEQCRNLLLIVLQLLEGLEQSRIAWRLQLDHHQR